MKKITFVKVIGVLVVCAVIFLAGVFVGYVPGFICGALSIQEPEASVDAASEMPRCDLCGECKPVSVMAVKWHSGNHGICSSCLIEHGHLSPWGDTDEDDMANYALANELAAAYMKGLAEGREQASWKQPL